jgi:glutamate racemase
MEQQNQENLSVVIVDSGMGGLSICAEIAHGFAEKNSHSRVNLTYFNAWPEQKRGYNSLPSQADRVRVFDSAMTAIEKLNPALILIACNTLSILFNETPFAKTVKIPVIGIIDFGVNMTAVQMQTHSESQAIILGTLTTVNSETHKNALIEKGFVPERVIGQQCDQLATRIESGPEKEQVSQMIAGFLGEAVGKATMNEAPVYVVFCCTHFGYARKSFERWLKHYFGDRAMILNPNTAMSRYVLEQFEADLVEKTTVDVTVLSRINWSDEKVEAIAETLKGVSPLTAEALRNYRQDLELFVV